MSATIHSITELLLPSPEFFIFNSSGKRTQDIPKDELLTIGKGDSCSITINDKSIDDIQIICRKIGTHLYFLECGSRNLLKYKGSSCNQINIEESERAVFKLGNSWIVYTGAKNKLKKLVLSHTIAEGNLGVQLRNSSPIYISNGHLLLGSHRSCDIQNEEWPLFAGILYFSPNGVFLERLDKSCEIILAKMTILQKIQIHRECRFTLDGIQVDLLIHGDLNEQCSIIFQNYKKPSSLCLIPLNTQEKYTIPLEANTRLTFGRSDKCDVTINSAQLSRLHTQVLCRERFVLISDNNSTNGTFINGRIIEKSKVLPGDIINFGELEFLLMYDEFPR